MVPIGRPLRGWRYFRFLLGLRSGRSTHRTRLVPLASREREDCATPRPRFSFGHIKNGSLSLFERKDIMKLTEDTRIIFIHGLASKPRKEDLHAFWREALIANIQNDSAKLASAMKANKDLFHSAYWANAVPDHIEDSPTDVNALKKNVYQVITLRKEVGKDLHISKKGWVKTKVKKFAFGIVDGLASAITVKDNVVNEHMREVRLYRGDQYIADRIRKPLEKELRDAWNKGKKVVVISHSMGTFISYDVLWRFSHRSEPDYKKYRNREVDLFITMGSPLGDSTLREFMLIERWKKSRKSKKPAERLRFYPTNIGQWQNYSAYGDVVCHDSTLKDDFFDGMRKNVRSYGQDDLRDYIKLYNPYRNTAGKANSHKSYGYLIQPKLSQKLRQFFGVP